MKKSNINVSQMIRNYFVAYLPSVQYWFTVYAMLGVILSTQSESF
jgi:hypothetical protein